MIPPVRRYWPDQVPWAAFACAAILATLAGPIAGAPEGCEYPVVFTQEPVEARGGGRARGGPLFGATPEGSRIVALQPDGTLSILTPGLAAARDPSVSFAGTRILFAGKRTSDGPWNIYEMSADGSSTRQITRDLGNCLEPLYLARASVTPPSFDDRVRWITFASTAAGVLDEEGLARAPSLYVTNLEPVQGRGTVLWRTTYNLGGDISPTTMRDGRVLFSGRQRGSWALMTITWAGDNINAFYGTHQGPAAKTMACEMPDRSVVFVESEAQTPDQGGRLARVWLRRPLHSHQVLSTDDGRYRNPHPLPDGGLVVSWTSGEESYGLYRFDFEAGRPGERVYDDPEWDDVDPVPLSTHPEPIARIPMLEFASVLDIKGFKGAGQLHCMSVYDSDVPEVAGLEPGEVKWVRFVEGVPVTAPSDDATVGRGVCQWPPPGVKTRLLGEAPVEADGSFFVNIAGNTPFFMQILDQDRAPLYTMRAWTWVRSGSQRGCIGCHENKELAPVNRATQALIKLQPTFVTTPPEERPVVDLIPKS
jgi:Tol biopolymer transport system component